MSGWCRGFGVVVVADANQSAAAFSLLNDTKLNGQRITIDRGTAHTNGKAGALEGTAGAATMLANT